MQYYYPSLFYHSLNQIVIQNQLHFGGQSMGFTNHTSTETFFRSPFLSTFSAFSNTFEYFHYKVFATLLLLFEINLRRLDTTYSMFTRLMPVLLPVFNFKNFLFQLIDQSIFTSNKTCKTFPRKIILLDQILADHFSTTSLNKWDGQRDCKLISKTSWFSTVNFSSLQPDSEDHSSPELKFHSFYLFVLSSTVWITLRFWLVSQQ